MGGKSTMDGVMSWLKSNWFIFPALVVGGIAWGTMANKVDTLEKRLTEKIVGEQKVDQLVITVVRLEEKIGSIIENNKERDERVENLREWLQKVNERVREMREAPRPR